MTVAELVAEKERQRAAARPPAEVAVDEDVRAADDAHDDRAADRDDEDPSEDDRVRGRP